MGKFTPPGNSTAGVYQRRKTPFRPYSWPARLCYPWASTDRGNFTMRPWLTVWLRPGDTIEHVLAGNPRHSVWLLAALGGMANFAAGFASYGWTTKTVGWQTMAAVACGGAIFSIVALYIQAWCLRWSGTMLGG